MADAGPALGMLEGPLKSCSCVRNASPAEDLQYCMPELLFLGSSPKHRWDRLQQVLEYGKEGLQKATIFRAVLQVGVRCQLSDVTQML